MSVLLNPYRFAAAGGGLGTPDVEDDFNRADSQLDTHATWRTGETGAGNYNVVSNQLVVTGAGQGIVDATYGNDQRARIKIISFSGSGWSDIGPVVRWTSVTQNWRVVIVREGSWVDLNRDSTNEATVTFATINTNYGIDLASPPYDVDLEAIGTSIKVYINETEITELAVTSASTPTGANLGIAGGGTGRTYTIDDFKAWEM